MLIFRSKNNSSSDKLKLWLCFLLLKLSDYETLRKARSLAKNMNKIIIRDSVRLAKIYNLFNGMPKVYNGVIQ